MTGWALGMMMAAALLGQDPGVESARAPVQVNVRGVDERGFPEITLDFEVRRLDGGALLDAKREDFRVTESGEPVEILSFVAPRSVELRPTSVVLVVDTSGSMVKDEDRMTPLKRAVATFLESMPAGSEVGVVAFGMEVRLISPLTTDLNRVKGAVDRLEPGGGTRFYDAVGEAIALLSESPGRRAILALTDGEDNLSREDSLETVIAAARGRVCRSTRWAWGRRR